MDKIYANDTDEKKLDKSIEQLIDYMNIEIDKYNYLPNNFMFIFPILSKNILANRLEAKIQEFWIDKFNDENYQNKVLINNEYWKNKISDNKYYKYVYLHKSDEGKSINLRESDNASKILSIHASKGNGCEVVFLLGLKQKSLQIFSKDKCNLQYDSLLHVALTRQKKSLYIGIQNLNDDISERLHDKNYDIELNYDIEQNINDIKKSNKYSKIVDYCCESNNHLLFNKIYNKYFSEELEKKIPDNKDQKNIIDWGHHLIRYCVFFYQLMYNIMNNEKMNDDNIYFNQFITILSKIYKLNIEVYNHNEYYKKIGDIKKNNIFPILIFNINDKSKYYKYKETLKQFIYKIQMKIKNNLKNKKLPLLCPLETIILIHMYKLYNNGKYTDITIMDIYSIIYYFDECSNSIDEKHEDDYKCLCKSHFNESNNSDNFDKYSDIRKSIINHHKKVEMVNILYHNYRNYIANHFDQNCDFKYNSFHPVVLYNDNDNNFKIYNQFEMIANSDKYVIDFIITPQFSQLNFNEIISKSIYHNFLLQNSCETHNNFERFNNKIIYTCILSLDSNKPIFFKFNINKDCDILKTSIKDYLLQYYSDKHKLIYHYYRYCKENKPKDKNSIEYTHQLILDYNATKKLEYYRIPKYIEDYYYDRSKELEKNKKNKNMINDIILQVDDQDIFFENIYKYLEDSIDKYLNNINNEEVDY